MNGLTNVMNSRVYWLMMARIRYRLKNLFSHLPRTLDISGCEQPNKYDRHC